MKNHIKPSSIKGFYMPKNDLTVKATTKKVKFLGTQSFINAETGEVVEMQVTDIEERDFNFTKVWMKSVVQTMELIGNKKTAVCFWIIDHLNRDNEICLNYRQIAEQTDASYRTVATTMQILQDVNFLRKVGTAYRVNPDIIFKGSHGARMAILQDYHSEPRKGMTDAEKLASLKRSADRLNAEIARLESVLMAEDAVIDAEIEGQLAFNEEGDIVEEAKVKPHRRKKSKG